MASSLLGQFEVERLPAHMQTLGEPFQRLAVALDAQLPDGTDKDIALGALLTAREAAGRAALLRGR